MNLFDPNLLSIARGNTLSVSIDMKDPSTGDDISLEDGDRVLFTVKNKRGDTVVKKVLTATDVDPDDPSNILCTIEAEQTIDLSTGEYLYDCLYVSHDNKVVTFISSLLTITPALGTYRDLEDEG